MNIEVGKCYQNIAVPRVVRKITKIADPVIYFDLIDIVDNVTFRTNWEALRESFKDYRMIKLDTSRSAN